MASRTAATISSRRRARFSRVPPYSSVRWLVAGERKPRTIEECEHCSSMPSKPPSRAVLGDGGVAGDDLGDLGRGRPPWAPRGTAGRPPATGAHTGRRVYIDDAWPPLWLIWAKIGVAVAVHGLGDAPVARDDVGVEAVDHLLVGPVGRVGRVLLGDDQPGAARGAGRVVGGVLLGGPAVLGVVREVGGEHDAVADRDRPELQRRTGSGRPSAVRVGGGACTS